METVSISFWFPTQLFKVAASHSGVVRTYLKLERNPDANRARNSQLFGYETLQLCLSFYNIMHHYFKRSAWFFLQRLARKELAMF